MKKDTIYIDLEDDITAIVDKLSSSSSKIVALVPPKRSTVLNSAVNMKLLKSTADDKKKQAVLVTSEPTLLSLAAGAGLFTTPNLHTKPSLPKAEAVPDLPDDVIDGEELDMDAPVGALAGAAAVAATAGDKAEDEAAATTAASAAKDKKGFKIPNFERFRSKLFLITAGVILLVLGWWWAFFLAPKAVVSIQAQTTQVDIDFAFNANTTTTEDDYDKNLFRAELVEVKSDKTEQFDATGKKNVGEKASGQATIVNSDDDDPITIAGGTIFTSSNGLKFESLEDVTVPGCDFDGGSCDVPGEAPANLRAVAPGEDYNLAADTTYDIDGVGSLIYGVGGQMSGGTDKEVTVVAQKDVDEAAKRLKETDKTEGLNELKAQAGEQLIVVDETYAVKTGKVASQPAVGAEAGGGAVSAEVSQTALAIPRSTLKTAVDEILNARIEGGDQSVYDDGMGHLVFEVEKRNSATNYDLRVTTEAHIGPTLDTTALAQDIAGMRYSEAVETVKSKPGVIDVQIDLSPFWVFSLPKAGNIQINLQVNDQNQS